MKREKCLVPANFRIGYGEYAAISSKKWQWATLKFDLLVGV